MTDELVKVEEVRVLTTQEKKHALMRDMEETMVAGCVEVISGTTDFLAIDPKNPDVIPLGWKKKYGPEGAIRRHRAAKYGIMSAKEAPIAIKVASQMAAASMKAAAIARGNTTNILNIDKVVFMAPRDPDEVIGSYEEVEDDGS